MRDINKIIAEILRVAAAKRESAGFSGDMGDGGAYRLEEQVKFYNHGVEGTFPIEWEEFETNLDPELPEYLRLKKKFKGR